MSQPYLLIVGRITVNVKATTCPDCGRGTEEFCGHFTRLIRAVQERLAREADQRERRRLSAILADMERNRAAIAASGEWDMAELAQGTKRAITWRQTLRVPHHTTGGDL
jgi:inhibitor of KinA sporulation pathway (predicted exonuclease)